MEGVRVSLQRVFSTGYRLYGFALEGPYGSDLVGANELTNGVVMFANKARALVPPHREHSKTTARHHWNTAEAIVFGNPATALALALHQPTSS